MEASGRELLRRLLEGAPQPAPGADPPRPAFTPADLRAFCETHRHSGLAAVDVADATGIRLSVLRQWDTVAGRTMLRMDTPTNVHVPYASVFEQLATAAEVFYRGVQSQMHVAAEEVAQEAARGALRLPSGAALADPTDVRAAISLRTNERVAAMRYATAFLPVQCVSPQSILRAAYPARVAELEAQLARDTAVAAAASRTVDPFRSLLPVAVAPEDAQHHRQRLGLLLQITNALAAMRIQDAHVQAEAAAAEAEASSSVPGSEPAAPRQPPAAPQSVRDVAMGGADRMAAAERMAAAAQGAAAGQVVGFDAWRQPLLYPAPSGAADTAACPSVWRWVPDVPACLRAAADPRLPFDDLLRRLAVRAGRAADEGEDGQEGASSQRETAARQHMATAFAGVLLCANQDWNELRRHAQDRPEPASTPLNLILTAYRAETLPLFLSHLQGPSGDPLLDDALSAAADEHGPLATFCPGEGASTLRQLCAKLVHGPGSNPAETSTVLRVPQTCYLPWALVRGALLTPQEPGGHLPDYPTQAGSTVMFRHLLPLTATLYNSLAQIIPLFPSWPPRLRELHTGKAPGPAYSILRRTWLWQNAIALGVENLPPFLLNVQSKGAGDMRDRFRLAGLPKLVSMAIDSYVPVRLCRQPRDPRVTGVPHEAIACAQKAATMSKPGQAHGFSGWADMMESVRRNIHRILRAVRRDGLSSLVSNSETRALMTDGAPLGSGTQVLDHCIALLGSLVFMADEDLQPHLSTAQRSYLLPGLATPLNHPACWFLLCESIIMILELGEAAVLSAQRSVANTIRGAVMAVQGSLLKAATQALHATATAKADPNPVIDSLRPEWAYGLFDDLPDDIRSIVTGTVPGGQQDTGPSQGTSSAKMQQMLLTIVRLAADVQVRMMRIQSIITRFLELPLTSYVAGTGTSIDSLAPVGLQDVLDATTVFLQLAPTPLMVIFPEAKFQNRREKFVDDLIKEQPVAEPVQKKRRVRTGATSDPSTLARNVGGPFPLSQSGPVSLSGHDIGMQSSMPLPIHVPMVTGHPGGFHYHPQLVYTGAMPQYIQHHDGHTIMMEPVNVHMQAMPHASMFVPMHQYPYPTPFPPTGNPFGG
jgi:hypothetical protein